MVSAETLRRIRRIELRTRQLVNDSFAGAYHSVFKGRGIEFEAVRPYEPGDEVRSIDWNVTARFGEPFVRRYVEERELTVMLLVDTSASCLFGTVNHTKRDAAVELAAVLAYAAIANNDKVGLLLFSDRVETYIAPRKGRNHTLRLIRDLLAAQADGVGTDLALALRTANRLLKRRAIVFLLSDFLSPGSAYAHDLALTARRHDTVAVVLSDPREQSWPAVGLIAVRDAETDVIEWMDTAHPAWRSGFAQQAQRFAQMRDLTLAQARTDRIDLPSDGDYLRALTLFFQRRVLRLRT